MGRANELKKRMENWGNLSTGAFAAKITCKVNLSNPRLDTAPRRASARLRHVNRRGYCLVAALRCSAHRRAGTRGGSGDGDAASTGAIGRCGANRVCRGGRGKRVVGKYVAA